MKFTEKVIKIVEGRQAVLDQLDAESKKIDKQEMEELIGAKVAAANRLEIIRKRDTDFANRRSELMGLISKYNKAVDDGSVLTGDMLNGDSQLLSTAGLNLTRAQLQAIADRNHDNPLVCQMIHSYIESHRKPDGDISDELYIDNLPASTEQKKAYFSNFIEEAKTSLYWEKGMNRALIMDGKITPIRCTESM